MADAFGLSRSTYRGRVSDLMRAGSAKPFLQPFGILAPMDFVTLFLCLALGTAALPSLLFLATAILMMVWIERLRPVWVRLRA